MVMASDIPLLHQQSSQELWERVKIIKKQNKKYKKIIKKLSKKLRKSEK